MDLENTFNGLMNNIGGLFNSMVITIIMWALILCVIAYFGYKWYLKKQIYRYPILILGSNNQIVEKKAKIINTKKGIAKLVVEGYEDPKFHLRVKEPNIIFNNRHTRLLSFDGFGYLTYSDAFVIKEVGLSDDEIKARKEKLLAFADSLGIEINNKYFEKIIIDKKKYLESALTPNDRMEAYDSYIESVEKGNVMTSIQKWAVTLGIILIVMGVIGNIMIAKYNVTGIEVANQGTENLLIASQLLQNNTQTSIKSIDQNTVMLINFAKALGQNITLEVNTK